MTTNEPTSIVTETGDASSTAEDVFGGKSNVGAIAGGTIGGLAALAILGAGTWLSLSRGAKIQNVTRVEP